MTIPYLEQYKNDVKYMRENKTPGTSRFGIVWSINKIEKISSVKQKLYLSGFGMWLYLMKQSHPDIANAVRELSKVLGS